MRRAFVYILMMVVLALSVSSCESVDTDKTAPVKALMTEALDSLRAGRYETYLKSYVDLSDMDSTLIPVLAKAYSQEQGRLAKTNGSFNGYVVNHAQLVNDSLAIVYYDMQYADGTCETCAQRLVCIDGQWKIKIRN